MKVDLTGDSLASRQAGSEQLTRLLERLGSCEAGEVVVLDLGEQLATVSWLDAFVVGLLRHLQETESACRALIVSASEDTREHVQLILDKRKMAIFTVQRLEDVVSGYITVLGHVSPGSNEVLEAIQRNGESTTSDIAEALSSRVEATQQRLNVLMDLGLVHREKFGRTFTYSLPVLHAADDLLAVA